MGKKSRDKGQRGEREVRDLMRQVPGWEKAERTVQARHGGRDASDVEGTPYHVEVKMQASAPRIGAAMAQARAEARPGRPPVVFTRRTSGPKEGRGWLVTMTAEDWISLQLIAAHYRRWCSERFNAVQHARFPAERLEADVAPIERLFSRWEDEDLKLRAEAKR